MPELNLEALKNKKRTTDKYRPYDIPTPVKKSKDKVLVVEGTKIETLPIDVNNEQVLGVEEIKTKSTNETTRKNNKEKAETTKINTAIESETTLKKKIAELEMKLNKSSGKDESLPSLSPTDSKFQTFKFKNVEIDNELIFRVLKTTSQWADPDRNLFIFLLEKTNFGKTNNIQLGRREIESKAVHGSYFKDARDKLQESGVLTFKIGYIGTSKKKGTFYSLNLRNLLD